MSTAAKDPLVHAVQIGDHLVVRKRKSPVRSKLLLTVIFLTLLAFVVAAYIVAARYRSGLWAYVVLAVLAMAALAERAWVLRHAAKRDEQFRFDKRLDRIEKNGELLAPLSEIDHILVRHIRPNDDEVRESDLALVIALGDTRRFTIADSTGLPEQRRDIERVAEQLAGYVERPVKQDSRLVTEWWLDQ